MDVVVTDHHSPRADGELPDAPLVHPRVNGYPCPDLCAAGVAHKLAQALLEGAGEDPALADEDLDLVALATVADVVPLQGENRRLVRDGLRVLAGTRKVGLRALMDVARVDPSGLDEAAIGFRLGPRLNAAGRLYRADAGLELLLTEDRERARAVAAELDAVNAERRDVETQIRFQAEALVAEHPDGPRPLVLAGEGWHPGVIGIVASRIAERHHRPAILIALDGEEGSGSGRSIKAFDLLGGLHASAGHLLRYGGHKAAAGLTIAASEVDAFREAFLEHAERGADRRGPRARGADRRRRPGRRAVARPRRGAPAARPVRHGQPGRLAARPGRDDDRAARDRRRPPRRLHAERRWRQARAASPSASATRCRWARTSSPTPPCRLEIDRWNGAVSPKLVLRQAARLHRRDDRRARRARVRRGGDARAGTRPPGARAKARAARAASHPRSPRHRASRASSPTSSRPASPCSP